MSACTLLQMHPPGSWSRDGLMQVIQAKVVSGNTLLPSADKTVHDAGCSAHHNVALTKL